MAAFDALNVTVLWNATGEANRSVVVPTGCILTSSSDGSDDLISPEAALLSSKIKSAVLVPLLFVVGAPTNLLNMIVFVKQGLHDRVNVCLFSLALVDFVAISFFFLLNSEQMFMFDSPDTYGPAHSFFFNNKLMIFYNTPFGSMFLSTIIAVERCICVVFPLHAKTLLKTRTMAAIIMFGAPLACFLRLVVMAKYVVVCFFDRSKQLTFMGLYITDYQAKNKELLDFIDGIIYGFFISVGCPVIALIATCITVMKLWQTASWRKHTSSGNTRKEMAVTKMLVLLSIEFLIFTSPHYVLRIGPLFMREFSAKGKYRLYFLAWANVAEISVLTGMALNFAVYCFSSSKYRNTLRNFRRKEKNSINFYVSDTHSSDH